VDVEARGVTEVEAGFVLVEGGGGCVGLMFKKDLTLTLGKAGALGRAGRATGTFEAHVETHRKCCISVNAAALGRKHLIFCYDGKVPAIV
jgi:hypothetical protein